MGGNVVNFYRDNLFSESSQLLITFLYQHFQDTPNQFFTSNNFSIQRTDFMQHGGFQNQFITSAGEDREFCVRLKHQGMELKFIPEVEIIHFHQMNLVSFIRLHRKYGKAAMVFQKIMESHKIAIQKRPRLEFYRKLMVFPFYQNHLSKKEKFFVSFSLMLSQICVAQGYLLEKTKSQKPLKVG
jgi:GT2 family glycosyltransferase